jgi:glucose-6-phosphate isomerase
MLGWKETCINVISKSGKTTETMAQFYIVRDLLLKKLSAKLWREHVFVTTDEKDGPLRALAAQEKLQGFVVPKDVGGRFSVLSSVGLFPAACVGVNIKELLSGAAAMNELCRNKDVLSNPAVANAAVHYLMDVKKNKRVSVMMPYSDSLALFSDWYAQLWAESLGKGGGGPTPVKAVGATDQHSQLQLYMEGPNDKVVTIMGVDKFRTQLTVPKNVQDDFRYIGGKDLGAILKAEETATTQALVKSGRPVIRVTVPEISAEAMGQLFMMYQIQTAIAGTMYKINPFDQPGVEMGKKLTREILSS